MIGKPLNLKAMHIWTDEDVFNLTLLDPQDVDFGDLPQTVLEKLALGTEPYFANYALGELDKRNPDLARVVSTKVLSSVGADPYLKAAALEVLYHRDLEAASSFMRVQVLNCDPYLLKTMMDLLLGETRESWNNIHTELGSVIAVRLAQLTPNQLDDDLSDQKESFLNRLSLRASKI